MVNELLYLLANRGTGFTYGGFVANKQFRPFPDTDAVARKVRELLLPSATYADYYLRACLFAIRTYPDLRTLFGPGEILDLSVPFVDDFGKLIPVVTNRPHYIWNDAQRQRYPINFRFRFRREADTVVSVHAAELGTTETYRVFERSSALDQDRSFQIQHDGVPDGVALEDRFGVAGSFEVGDQFWVTYYPKAFPYRALASHLTKFNDTVLQLLSKNLWEERYLTTPDAIERVALVAAALALRPLYA